jgi:hypothetical protein
MDHIKMEFILWTFRFDIANPCYQILKATTANQITLSNVFASVITFDIRLDSDKGAYFTTRFSSEKINKESKLNNVANIVIRRKNEIVALKQERDSLFVRVDMDLNENEDLSNEIELINAQIKNHNKELIKLKLETEQNFMVEEQITEYEIFLKFNYLTQINGLPGKKMPFVFLCFRKDIAPSLISNQSTKNKDIKLSEDEIKKIGF